MTDRDRLADIIDSFFGCDSAYFDIDKYELADHLLANGVKLVPCLCKDCAYFRESDITNRAFCTYHGDDYEIETFPNHYCSSGVGMLKGA